MAVGGGLHAARHLGEPAAAGATDWRIAWYHGLCALAAGQPDRARGACSAVCDELPGELALSLDDLRRQQLTVEISRAALEWVVSSGSRGGGSTGQEHILGCEPNERALGFGLERGYRVLASLTPDPVGRIELVDMANTIRPRTWT